MFQMEFTRRVARDVSPIRRREGALQRHLFRGVGFNERAKDYAKKLDPGFRALYQRYVDGVNYYLDKNGTNAYMKLLGMKKEKWEISDSVLVGMMLNWSLAYNMKHELLYHRILKKIGKEKGSMLLSLTPAKTPTIVDDIAGLGAGDEAFAVVLKKLDWLLGCRSASNNWAVGPALTAHGGAILCSDMQVHQSKLPNDFYLIRVPPAIRRHRAQVVGLRSSRRIHKNCAWGLTNQGRTWSIFSGNDRLGQKDVPHAARTSAHERKRYSS